MFQFSDLKFLLALFIFHGLYAGRIHLRNGSSYEIPDVLSIYNDLPEPISIQTQEQQTHGVDIPGGASFSMQVNSENDLILNKESKKHIALMLNFHRYLLHYPTYHHLERKSHSADSLDHAFDKFDETTFMYKASDIVANKCDPKGFTIHNPY